MTNGVFSEYELREMAIKIQGAAAYAAASCVGSVEEEMESKTVSKSCRGVVVKRRTKGSGAGTLTISMHMPYALYIASYGMELNTLASGVKAYGQNSVHKTMSIVMHVYDEDGAEMYKAYPNCMITAAKTAKIENGAEEVAEIEMEISVMPDDYGNGMYEALATDITTEIKNAWMTSFTPALVQVSATVLAISNALTFCSCDNTATSIVSGGDYFATYTAAAGKALPAAITVKFGSTSKTAGTDYLWNQATGRLYVPNVTGALNITITAA